MSHTPTGTIAFEDDDGIKVAVATVVCSCGHRAESRHDDNDLSVTAEEAAEDAAWSDMTAHLGYDPRKTPTGIENTSATD